MIERGREAENWTLYNDGGEERRLREARRFTPMRSPKIEFRA